MPPSIKNSKILTGNHLGMLANVEMMPEQNESIENDDIKNTLVGCTVNEWEEEVHNLAAKFLNENKIEEAWQVLLMKNK